MKFKDAKLVPIQDIKWRDLQTYSKYDMMQENLKSLLRRYGAKDKNTSDSRLL